MEQGCTALSYDPEAKGKKIPVADWLKLMGRTKHLCGDKYETIREDIQQEIDRRWQRLKARADHPQL